MIDKTPLYRLRDEIFKKNYLYMTCTYCKLVLFTKCTVKIVQIAKCMVEEKLIICSKMFFTF